MKRSRFLTIIGWVLLLSSFLLSKWSVAYMIFNLAAVILFSTAIGMQVGETGSFIKRGSNNE